MLGVGDAIAREGRRSGVLDSVCSVRRSVRCVRRLRIRFRSNSAERTEVWRDRPSGVAGSDKTRSGLAFRVGFSIFVSCARLQVASREPLKQTNDAKQRFVGCLCRLQASL